MPSQRVLAPMMLMLSGAVCTVCTGGEGSPASMCFQVMSGSLVGVDPAHHEHHVVKVFKDQIIGVDAVMAYVYAWYPTAIRGSPRLLAVSNIYR